MQLAFKARAPFKVVVRQAVMGDDCEIQGLANNPYRLAHCDRQGRALLDDKGYGLVEYGFTCKAHAALFKHRNAEPRSIS